MEEFNTPMMRQYMGIKKQYPDCLLFFRLGDFYELFLNDAILGSRVLDIVLTKRPRGKDGDIPMAGVPFHAADAYIAKLVKAGHKVAICEQVSEPNARGIVEREVIRIVTPGTILDEKTLEAKEHNYTMSISLGDDVIGIAFADISTGDFQVTEVPFSENLSQILGNEVTRFLPAECIVNQKLYSSPFFLKTLTQDKSLNVTHFPEWDNHAETADKKLTRHFAVKTLRSFGLAEKEHATRAAGALLGYLLHTQKGHVGHITALKTYSPGEHVALDSSTILNLEIFRSLRDSDERGSLIECLDETKTAMGGRLLRRWLREPLRNKKQIEARQSAVESLLHERSVRKPIQETLSTMYDIERIISRLSVNIGNPHDLINLKETLKSTHTLSKILLPVENKLIQDLIEKIPESEYVIEHIDSFIVDHPPFDPREGGVIKSGIHRELDGMRESIRESQEWIASLETKEQTRTGIGSLKVKFNSVFGYYIEVTRSNLDMVPKDYIRKQTTVNAERFITPELQKHEEIVLRGQEKIYKLEFQIFKEVIDFVLTHTKLLQSIAENIATLDCLTSFSHTADHERYVKPSITTDGEIKIEDGRHPVVEKIQNISFVPNNTLLSNNGDQLLVITGPNMAGKSVYMRQVAIITLMAHIGSFVPAKRASISLVDRIFVRSGASDSIGRGLSTFMVEMVETAYILHHATEDSLIIMDEIGRGTATYDGISIAWAIAEYLVTHPEHAAKTLFATHYHELQDLEKHHPEKIKNFHMAIEEHKENPVFLYRLTRGGAHGSYAIAVAKLAGVPEKVTKRATELLKDFDKKEEK
ncbi:MAG: mismatch repair protein MutS [Candidatus Paceibacter sp.]|jgi:DNA mismatch repair protein MutS|nr:mismatch repair protein MutS [Candidatus Paceibacter sp.]